MEISSVQQAEGHNENVKISAVFEKSKKHNFDLELVQNAFQRCLGDESTLFLEEYLNAYHELCRFFKLVGPLFSFVARDIESKINAIEYRMRKKHGNHYQTIESMIKFEISRGKTHRKGLHPSGSRTLLRLHHALEFILAFMERITDSEDDAKTSAIAWQVYSETLSKHHPWLTQKLAFIAVYALPSKQELIEIMCKHDYESVQTLLSDVFYVGQRVYNVTQSVFESFDLLHIP